MGEQPARLAEFQYWRAEILKYLRKHDEAIEAGEIGLSFLGENLECPQAAKILHVMGSVYCNKGDYAEAERCWSKNASMIHKLGYFDKIFRIYTGIARREATFAWDLDAAIAWSEEALRVCRSHGDDIGVMESYFHLGIWHSFRGNMNESADCFERSIELCEKIGFILYDKRSRILLAETMLKLGDDTKAAEYLRVSGTDFKYFLEPWYLLESSRAWLDSGNTEKAIEMCMEILMGSESLSNRELVSLLGITEEAYEVTGRRDDFLSLCSRMKETDVALTRELSKWYLEPGSPSERFTEIEFLDDFDESELNPRWKWVDPRDDCSYSMCNGWLRMQVSPGRNLFLINFSAPRLLLDTSGDFAIETKISPTSGDMPSVGGLLVWKDEKNFIRFEKGMNGKHEIGLSSHLNGHFHNSGRGLLMSSVTHLRLERSGNTFRAYCSGDGTGWMTCGEVTLSAEGSIQVGIHAIGSSGLPAWYITTATQFGCFRVLRRT